jgi:regulator of RNase E activity RraA
MTAPLTTEDLDRLRGFDTPTVCNAMERVMPERTGIGFTTKPLVCAHPELPPMVGYARTGTIRATHPSLREGAEDLEARLAYYEHMAEGPQPTITVIEDLDATPGFGAWWGEVNTHVHRGLGSLGLITNGSIRDLDEVAENFQLLAGSVGPSHAFVHVVESAVTVTVAGMTVHPGDLIHADRHGAVVIPIEAARQIPEAAEQIVRGESVLIEASKQPDFSFEVMKKMMTGGRGRQH